MCVDLSSSNCLNFKKCTRKCCVDTNTFYCAIFRLSTPFGKSNLQIKNSKSSCTTFQQQIRAFNLMTSDVSLPTRNPLHSITADVAEWLDRRFK